MRAGTRRRDMPGNARKRARRRPSRVRFGEIRREKFFWITSLNRVVDGPIAIGIERITR